MATLSSSDLVKEVENQTASKNTIPKKSSRHKKSNVFIYPSARDIREYEDSFMIKCIDYINPPGMGGLGGTFVDKTTGGLVDINAPSEAQIKKGLASNDVENGVKVSETYKGVKSFKEEIKNAEFIFQNNSRTDEITKPGTKIKHNFFVELPIPQQINDNQAVTWGDETVNIFELAGLAVGSAVLNNGGLSRDSMQRGMRTIQALTGRMNLGLSEERVQNAVVAAASGMAVNALGSNLDVNSVLSRSTGQVLNSNLELLFRGVQLRSFPFDVTFAPRDPKEAQVVKNIIRNLKQAMSARKSSGNASDASSQGKYFLAAPSLFLLRYLKNGEDHPFLNAFKPCALTQLNVNYTGSGTYSTYGDSTPTNIQMRMVFKEINPIYAEDYEDDEQGLAGPGVGY